MLFVLTFFCALSLVSGTERFNFANPLPMDEVFCSQPLAIVGENHPATHAARVRIIDNSYEGRVYQGFNAPLVLHDQSGSISLNDGFVVPEIGQTTQLRDVLLEVTLADTTRTATVPLKYRCTAEDIAAIAETEKYFRQICAEMTDLADVYRSPERLMTHMFPNDVVACSASDDKTQCTCLTERLRSWKQLQVEFEWARCDEFGFDAIDFAATTTTLLGTITSNACVSAPCGRGGFCATDSVCNTNQYVFFSDDQTTAQCGSGESVGCCEPPCTIGWPYRGLVQPGSCLTLDDTMGTPVQYESSLDQPGRRQFGDMICYPLPSVGKRRHSPNEESTFFAADGTTDDSGFYDVGVFGCTDIVEAQTTHCCAAVACTTGDYRFDTLDGLCMDQAKCPDHPSHDATVGIVGARCNDPSNGVKCCAMDGPFQVTSREIANPKTNQQSAQFRPSFRAETSDASSAAPLSLAAVITVAAIGAQ